MVNREVSSPLAGVGGYGSASRSRSALRRRRPRLGLAPWRAFLALASGLLLTWAFPPKDAGWIAWLALIPLTVAVRGVRLRAGFVAGLLAGTVFFALSFLYIRQFGLFPWLALAVFQGLFVAVFGFLASLMWRCRQPWLRVSGVAGAWAAGELLRGYCGALGFTFCDLAYSQYRAVAIMQVASLVGHYGLGFIMALSGAALVEAVPRPSRRGRAPTGAPLIIVGLGLVVAVAWGQRRAVRIDADVQPPAIGVVAVQASGGPEPPTEQAYVQEVTRRYIARSMADGRGADLIVWPETAVPARINESAALADWVRSVPVRLRCALLAGAAEAAPGDVTYNTLWGYGPKGESIGRYRKQQLVIFGEYVPWRDTLRFLKRYPIRDFDYSPGQEDVLIPVKGFGVAPMICFESIFPDISRRLVREGATVLVVATSDSWVGAAPAELWQHAQASPFRAVENGRWLIRAASTGVTCLISPNGRLAKEAPINAVASVRGFVWPRSGMALYTMVGDWPLVALVSLLLLAGVRDLRPFGRTRRSAA